MALGAPLHCRRLTHWMQRLAARRPLGLVLERQSSQAKDGFVESKKVSIVFRAELTAADERAARLSPKTRTPPESAALGGGFSGTLIWWCTKGFCYEGSVSQIHGRGRSFITERRAVGFLRHLANILARSHCWAIFLFECHNQNTSGGVRMGVETILLIVVQ